jgi:hypothetical protein
MKRQVLISSLILLFIQTLASAGVLYVPSRDYPTIQSAINAAVNGDVVVVAPDVYTGTGNVDLDFGGTTGVLLLPQLLTARVADTTRTVLSGFTVAKAPIVKFWDSPS